MVMPSSLANSSIRSRFPPIEAPSSSLSRRLFSRTSICRTTKNRNGELLSRVLRKCIWPCRVLTECEEDTTYRRREAYGHRLMILRPPTCFPYIRTRDNESWTKGQFLKCTLPLTKHIANQWLRIIAHLFRITSRKNEDSTRVKCRLCADSAMSDELWPFYEPQVDQQKCDKPLFPQNYA